MSKLIFRIVVGLFSLIISKFLEYVFIDICLGQFLPKYAVVCWYVVLNISSLHQFADTK